VRNHILDASTRKKKGAFASKETINAVSAAFASGSPLDNEAHARGEQATLRTVRNIGTAAKPTLSDAFLCPTALGWQRRSSEVRLAQAPRNWLKRYGRVRKSLAEAGSPARWPDDPTGLRNPGPSASIPRRWCAKASGCQIRCRASRARTGRIRYQRCYQTLGDLLPRHRKRVAGLEKTLCNQWSG
jgi:hypothetical protein